MDIYRRKTIWKASLLLIAVLIGLGSLLYTRSLVLKLKAGEKEKAEQWAEATRRITGSTEDIDFLFRIIENNNTVPVILADGHNNVLSYRNLPKSVSADTSGLARELKRMGGRNEPIVIEIPGGERNYLYFNDSIILRKLKVYPFIQLGVILLFITVAYVAFSTSRVAEQNQVWVGLSRETAHQLGTPISSLAAWVELFRVKHPGSDIMDDLSEDVRRLGNIADRFSLIGSRPRMYPVLLSSLVETTAEYLRKRIPSTIDLTVIIENGESIEIEANAILLSWVLENLVKNSVDAVKGSGTIIIRLSENEKHAFIEVEDSGRGIPKKDFRTIFKPGYTTRERGWGLGLSLSKRIIEDYHKGKIEVKDSEPGRGTCMRISLRKR